LWILHSEENWKTMLEKKKKKDWNPMTQRGELNTWLKYREEKQKEK
jgi:hypothetical protein